MERTPNAHIGQCPLIAITDRELLGMGGLASAVQSALQSGLPGLMLREKDLPDDQWLILAREMRSLTARFGVGFIVNRRMHLAHAVGADAVHLGSESPSITQARSELGTGILIGYSAHTVNEALEAFAQGADYVFFSPIFSTPSKAGILEPIGLDPLERLVQSAPGPVYGLGGVDAENAGQIATTGAGIAVIRAVFGQVNPGLAVKELLQSYSGTRKKAGLES